MLSEIIVHESYSDLMPVEYGREECCPSHHFGPAMRGYWLLHFVVSGFGTFVREGVTHKIGPGQMFVIPPDIVTYYEADNVRPWSYIWLGFTCDGDLPVKLQPVVICPEAGDIFNEMNNCTKFESGRSAYLRSILWKLFSLLLEQSKHSPDYIDMALSYMNTEYINSITVSDVADKLGLDRCYFSGYFKKRVGVSPQKYLLNLRMEKAAALMINSREKPSIAAASVGYNDIFVFSKAFKRHFGVSPREYCAERSAEQ